MFSSTKVLADTPQGGKTRPRLTRLQSGPSLLLPFPPFPPFPPSPRLHRRGSRGRPHNSTNIIDVPSKVTDASTTDTVSVTVSTPLASSSSPPPARAAGPEPGGTGAKSVVARVTAIETHTSLFWQDGKTTECLCFVEGFTYILTSIKFILVSEKT